MPSFESLSRPGDSAVDDQCRAHDIVAGTRGEEYRGAGHVFGRPDPASSISFSRKTVSYRPSPSLRGQSPTSMVGFHGNGRMIRQAARHVQKSAGVARLARWLVSTQSGRLMLALEARVLAAGPRRATIRNRASRSGDAAVPPRCARWPSSDPKAGSI
jgi:hypothetical protein